MKKLMYLLVVVLLASCSKPVTSYQVFNNSVSNPSTVEPLLNGDLYEVVVYCYAGSDIVRQDNFAQISCGEKTAVKEVPEAITKIKVSYKLIPPQSQYYTLSSNTRSYVKAYTLIEPQKNVISELNGNTMTSSLLSVKASFNSVRSNIPY